MSIRGVLFDLDDTLYSELSYVRSGFVAVADHLRTRFGVHTAAALDDMQAVLQTEGRGRIFDVVLTRYGLFDPALVAELVAVYRRHRPVIQLDPEAVGVLVGLRRRGFRLGVLTDGLAMMQRNKVAALGLDRLADEVVCTDELGPDRAKPHQAGFVALLERLGLTASEAWYVGNDPVKDIAGARALGLTTIYVARAGASDPTAAYSIRALGELLPLLDALSPETLDAATT